jgi:glycosyltransferase involved in cell wall biosynthesis
MTLHEQMARGRPATDVVRVLAVIDRLIVGGAENLLCTLARAGATEGVAVDVVSLAELTGIGVEDELRRNGAAVGAIGARRLADPSAMRRLVGAVRASNCDLVHAHLESAATLAPVAARLAGVPVVSSFHHVPGDRPRREQLKERLAVRSAETGDAVLAVSQAQLRAFARHHRLRPERWRVVPNGIEVERFASADRRRPAGLPPTDGRPLVSLVAAFRAGKGHHEALDAWCHVVRQVPDAHLLLVGGGALEEEVRHRVRTLGLDGSVTCTGVRPDVPQILAASDLVVLASQSEALPTALMEAAAAGVAVVATDVGGTGEVVVDGRTGVLVPPGDPVAFADAVAGLLLDPARRARFGRHAREHAVTNFGVQAWTARLGEVYRSVLRADTRPRV